MMELAMKSEQASPGGGKIDKDDMRKCFRRLRDNEDIKKIAANIKKTNVSTYVP